MTTINTLTALAAGALALSAAGAAQAQTPYTSYGRPSGVPPSCRNVESLANGYVSAECQADGGWRWSTIRQTDCRGAIANRNGVLSCSGATATTGPLYADSQTQAGVSAGPGGVIGSLLGALFGIQPGNDQALDDIWSRGRRPLNERRADLDVRIDAGVRDGSLTRFEADRLRDDYDDLVRLEARYAADGRLTTQERADLRDRYRALSQRVGDERRDDQGHDRWAPLSGRRLEFDARVDAALRDRTLNRTEAERLRADFQALLQAEADYMRNGLDAREQADLQLRYDDLNRRLGDDDGYGGYGDDRNVGRWAAIEARISAGERSGVLDRVEAARLRTELGDLTRLDAAYVRDGLSADERDYLTRRFGELDARVRASRY